MKKIDNSPGRVIDVIHSCTTMEQIEAAVKYSLLWLDQNGMKCGMSIGAVSHTFRYALDRQRRCISDPLAGAYKVKHDRPYPKPKRHLHLVT